MKKLLYIGLSCLFLTHTVLCAVDKEIWLINDWDSTSGKITVIDEQGNLLRTFTGTSAWDGLCYDGKNKQLWFNKASEGAGTANFVYQSAIPPNASTLIAVTELTTSGQGDTGFDLEGVCVDLADDTIWVISDHDDGGNNQLLQNRQSSDPNQLISNIELSGLGILGPQAICYNTKTDTLYISDNDTAAASSIGEIYNLTKIGTVISTLDIQNSLHFSLTGLVDIIQGIVYDERNDSLWIAARSNWIYNITLTGDLIKAIQTPFTDTPTNTGPAGIVLCPWGTRAIVLEPVLSLPLYDDTASTDVMAQRGATSALNGGDNTSVKNTTGPILSAFAFNGTDDSVDFGDVVLINGSFSISMWIKPTDFDADMVILGDADNRDWMRINSATTIGSKMNNISQTTMSGLTLTAGQWQHLVIVSIASDDGQVWVNGVKQYEAAMTGANFTPEYIGVKAGFGWYKGGLSNVMLFDRRLESYEIEYLYNSGSGQDHLMETVTNRSGTTINSVRGWRARYLPNE